MLQGEEVCELLNSAFQQTICLGSCLLLADCSLLSKAYVQNIQNISEISQESNFCERLCCPSQTWPEAGFQIQRIFWIFIQDLEFSDDFCTHKIALLAFLFNFPLVTLVLCISCLHRSLCNVTFALQRKLLLLEIQVFLSHQALLVPCMNRLWIKASHLWAQ